MLPSFLEVVMGFTKHFCVVVLPIMLAVAIPFVAVNTFRNYSCDIEIFATWADCVWNGRAVNGVCERFRINYPSVGIFFSAGVMQILSWVGFEGPFQVRAQPFRLVAAAVDSINILLFMAMLRALRVRFAELWTILFAVLPSSRVGGAMFGQIDGVSQLFLSLGFLSAHQAWSVLDMKERLGRVHVWLLVLSTSILCAVSTKQLVVFTIPVLGILFLHLCHKTVRAGCRIWPLALGVSIVVLALSISDRLFPVPNGFGGSVMLYSLLAGSGHGGEISNNGFNIFTLLSLPPSSKSGQWYPFFNLFGVRVSGLPMYIGPILFTVANLAAIFSLRCLLKSLARVDATTGTVAALAMAAFLNLSLNVFLTGTHERYLYHYGFFVVPCLLWLRSKRKVSLSVLAITLAHLTIYGLYVFSVIGRLPSIMGIVSSQRVLTMATLVICIVALVGLVKAALYCRTRGPSQVGG